MTTGTVTSRISNVRRAFESFRIVFAAVIFLASGKTIVDAIAVTNWALVGLATVEAIAAMFLLVPRFIKPAGFVLSMVFALAIMLSVVGGVVMSHLHLLIYLPCAYFIAVHGPAGSAHHHSEQIEPQ